MKVFDQDFQQNYYASFFVNKEITWLQVQRCFILIFGHNVLTNLSKVLDVRRWNEALGHSVQQMYHT